MSVKQQRSPNHRTNSSSKLHCSNGTISNVTRLTNTRSHDWFLKVQCVKSHCQIVDCRQQNHVSQPTQVKCTILVTAYPVGQTTLAILYLWLVWCQFAVYLNCQYTGCPCLFTLEEAIKLCERSPIQIDVSVKFTSIR